MRGEPVSGGISHGKAYLISDEPALVGAAIQKDQVEQEIARMRAGRDRAAKELEALIEKVRAEMGEDKAEIFEGHLEILTSDDLEEEVAQIISEHLICAEQAVETFAEANAREMEELDGEYFRERGQDFRDIGKQVIKGIQGGQGKIKELPARAVVVSEELTPSQTAALDLSKVCGFVVRKGGKNSHAAIIARSMEIPAILLKDPDPRSIIHEGDTLYIDGDLGDLWINPDKDQIRELNKKDRRNKKEKAELLKLLKEPAVTSDGHEIGLYANVGGAHDIACAVKYNADGIGLFRTEFLFMETLSAPSLKRQTEVYRSAIEAMQGQNVIIRLLDTGADKPLPYWSLPTEDNPFLGIRGIRLLFEKEDVLRTQIQALLTASEAGSVGMMIPMIGSLRPIERIKALIAEEKLALDWQGPDNLKVGVMIETPAAVQLIDEILDVVDFISIGTNDLTQYTLAADRGNPAMRDYYDELHPAVIRSIAHVIRRAKAKGVLNGICGELAGNLQVLPFFLGLGVEEISVTPARILELKKLVRQIDFSKAETLVEEILRIPTSDGIRARLNRFLMERDLQP
jgi:phosphotransferase system enzyme I (PtsI)